MSVHESDALQVRVSTSYLFKLSFAGIILISPYTYPQACRISLQNHTIVDSSVTDGHAKRELDAINSNSELANVDIMSVDEITVSHWN